MIASVFGMLAFLAAIAGTVIAVVVIVYLAATRKWRPALALAKWTLGGLALYFAVLLIASITSTDKVLAVNEEKRFCAADCDLAFSVTAVQTAKTLGEGADNKTANGTFYVVTVNIRSDAARVTMKLNDAVRITAVDSQRREYSYSPDGQAALDRSRGITTPLQIPWVRSLAPGQSASRDIVFDFPSDAQSPQLLISEGGFETSFLIGDENSFLHKKTLIKLGP